jgi:phosphoribosylglycinamide formyltransferase-1
MKKIGPMTLSRFRGRILNTHPALLPKFGGRGMYCLHVHRAVLAAGEPTTGSSVHMVSEEYDEGPVLAQCEVPVELTDTPETLAERVQKHERWLVLETLGGIATGRLHLPAAKDDAPPATRFNGPGAHVARLPAAERGVMRTSDGDSHPEGVQ